MQTMVKNQINYEGININAIESMEMVTGKNRSRIMVINCNEDHYEFSLNDAFGIIRCNNFLNNLNLGCNIEFLGYKYYAVLISYCMKLLEIRRILENEELEHAIAASKVFEIMLDELSCIQQISDWNDSYELQPYVMEAVQRSIA